MAGSKRKIYFPISGANNIGNAVAKTPQKNKANPTSETPFINVGPAVIPTTAINTLSPTEFINQSVALGTLPNVGWKLRSQPKIKPIIKAPPEVESVNGIPAT